QRARLVARVRVLYAPRGRGELQLMHLGTEVERAADRSRGVDVDRRIAHRIDGDDGTIPLRRIEVHQSAEVVLGVAHRGDGVAQRLFAGGDLHARLQDVERRRGAHIDANLRNARLVAGQEERLLPG